MAEATVSNLISAAAGLIGAIIGGLLAYRGAIYAVNRASQDLEQSEIRRLKVECITALTGLRWVISDMPIKPVEYKARLMFELNRIPALWANEPEVLINLRDFQTYGGNDRFVVLVRSLGSSTKLSIESLSDSDLRTILRID